jgi:hypothetical protein
VVIWYTYIILVLYAGKNLAALAETYRWLLKQVCSEKKRFAKMEGCVKRSKKGCQIFLITTIHENG